jgi:hypothetical protein
LKETVVQEAIGTYAAELIEDNLEDLIVFIYGTRGRKC